MTYINAGTSPNQWAASTTSHSGTGAIAYNWNATNAANAWAIIPGQLLTAGQTYTVTFWYRVISSTFPEKLKVTVGTNNTVAAQTTTLWDNNGGANLINTTYAQGTMTYTPSTTGTYYFAWNCYSDANEDILYVDDIAISGAQAAPATFSWTSSPAGFTSALQNPTGVVVSTNTTYIVTVSNSGGCSVQASTPVGAIVLPATPTGTGSTQCGLGTATWTATSALGGGESYRWYTTNVSTTILGTASTYTASISTTTVRYLAIWNGTCESSRAAVTAIVNQPDPVVATSNGPVCPNTSLTLTATVTTGANANTYAYTWTASPSAGSGIPTSVSGGTGSFGTPTNTVITPTVAGTYVYTVTGVDGICTYSNTVTVTVNALPIQPVPTATPAVICPNGSSQLDAGTYVAGTVTTPVLGGNGNAGNVFDITATNTVTITSISMGITAGTLAEVWYKPSSYGCTSSLTSNVGWSLLTASGGNAITPAGASPALTNIPLSSTVTIPAGQTYGFVVVCNGTNYYTNGTTLCAINASDANIGIGQGLGGSAVLGGGTWTFTNSVRNFNGSVGYTFGDPSLLYSWSPTTGLNDPTLISPVSTLASGSQSYHVTVTNAAGCSRTSLVPATVTVSSAPTSVPTAAPGTICVGSSSTLSANAVGAGPFTYLWSTSAATATISVSPTTTTTYTVVVTDNCGISTAPQSVQVFVNPLPTASINEGPTTICAPATYGLSVLHTAAPTVGYQWTRNGANITTGGTSATYAVSTSGSYAVKVTDGVTGCTVTSAAVVITVNPQPSAVTVTPATYSLCTGASVTLVASGGTIGGTYDLGTAATTTSTSGITPYNSLWEGSRQQYLVLASELNGLGMTAGAINSLSFDVTIAGPGTFAQSGFNIKIANTANTSLTGYGTPSGSFTTVYGPVTQGAPTVGLNTYTFSTPYNWDGVSNLLVDVCHDNDISNGCSSCFSTSSTVKYTATGYNSTYGSYADNVQACGNAVGSLITTFNNRPNMRFNSSASTAISWTPATGLNTTTGATVIASPTTSTTYTAKATSTAGCESVGGTSVITVADCPVTVNLKLWLQGYYQPGGTMAPVWDNQVNGGVPTNPLDVDNVSIELRDPTTYSLVETQTAMLHTNGLVSATFLPKAFGPYYVVVKHRNSIQTWSANPVAITGTTPLYNFASAPAQALGSNQALAETGVWAMYTGDVNQDDFIDSNDFPDLDNDIFNGVAFVYATTDLNGDGFVDSNDFPVMDNNIFNGVAAVVLP